VDLQARGGEGRRQVRLDWIADCGSDNPQPAKVEWTPEVQFVGDFVDRSQEMNNERLPYPQSTKDKAHRPRPAVFQPTAALGIDSRMARFSAFGRQDAG
jgi:hypothetical protein